MSLSSLSRRVFVATAAALTLAVAGCAGTPVASTDPLPSWNDGASKKAIVAFVDAVTREGGASYVPPAERIAVFDNDGTLWAEQPLYFQFIYWVDQARAAAPQHPEWKTNPVYDALVAGDMARLLANQKAMFEILTAASAGISVEDYDRSAREWLAKTRHPTTGRLYTEMVYQPQLELLAYLRGKGFKTFIVSGGSHEFMRPWSEAVYGIPPEQVVGSFTPLKFESYQGNLALVRQPGFEMNDGPTKPVGIYRQIGRRPILAVGNSDGDLQMLQFTTEGPGRRLGVIVHHDDAAREYAYDRQSGIGKLDKALDEARTKGWTVVSMKDEWKQIYPPSK